MTSKELLKTDIVVIYEKRLNKYWECSYGAFLKNWSNYGWKIINKKQKSYSDGFNFFSIVIYLL